MAYTTHQTTTPNLKSESALQRTELLDHATKRLNKDQLFSEYEIQKLMGIDISHQRDRIKEKIANEKKTEPDDSSRETILIVVLTVGISVGIGVLSLQFL